MQRDRARATVMDARAAESALSSKTNWLARERASGRFYNYAALGTGGLLIVIAMFSALVLSRGAEPGTLLSPPLIALLLIGNLIPAIALMVLFSRRLALRRAEEGGLGSGRLHTRLVALFSVIAAVPTVIVAIFASFLIQSGLEFWFSDRARNMLENTVAVARLTYQHELDRVASEATTMSGDLATYLQQVPIEDPQFQAGLAFQTYRRSLNEAAIVRIDGKNAVQTLAVATGTYGLSLDNNRVAAAAAKLARLPDNASVDVETPGRLSVLTRLGAPDTYLYVGRVDDEVSGQIQRANEVLGDYRSLLERSR